MNFSHDSIRQYVINAALQYVKCEEVTVKTLKCFKSILIFQRTRLIVVRMKFVPD